MSSSEQGITQVGIDISDSQNIIEAINENKEKENNLKHKAIIRAFLANIGIALVKLICFFFSRSSAMLAEAIHSGVDSFNSICLWIGVKRGARPADSEHPFGYGLEANIWTMLASLLMLLGAGVAIFHGGEKFFNPHGIEEMRRNYNYIAIALVISMCFEAWAVNSAVQAVLHEAEVVVKNPLKRFFVSLKHIKSIQSPTTKFVWYEDTAAFLGVLIALVALSLAKILPLSIAHIPDAIASIVIGCILLYLAFFLLKNNVNSLTVQSAEPRVEEIIRNVASTIHGITHVVELKTIDLGSTGVVINMTIEVDPETQMKDADDIAQMLERKIRKYIRNVNDVTIELQAHDEEDNWEEKFDKLIIEGQKIEAIDAHEANMLSNFYSFANTVVREVMVPRTEIVFADVNSSIYEIADIIINSGHTRLPLYEDNVDNILGVINAKDVLKVIKNNNVDENFSIKSLARDITIVPENKFISDLLSDLTSSKNQIAAVMDEHGGIVGIVTIEDIIEEITGEIYDEFDKVETPEIVKIDDNTLSVAARASIDDFNERFDQDIPNEDFQTIGGYVFGLLGREPELNDIVEDKNIKYTILELDNIKITRVKMEKDTPFQDKKDLDKEEKQEEE
ncbi:MAG: cation diffusion facilitator family transporter [Candidatus Gastranaerophilales bacterium]|nr:cation diffusion facilitator family transporter [Candidatus Gastranaerophilales bacterium]